MLSLIGRPFSAKRKWTTNRSHKGKLHETTVGENKCNAKDDVSANSTRDALELETFIIQHKNVKTDRECRSLSCQQEQESICTEMCYTPPLQRIDISEKRNLDVDSSKKLERESW